MLTIVWNRHGFLLIDVFPKGSKFDARHSISHILSPLPEILALVQDIAKRFIAICADNARLHCAKTASLFLDHNSLRQAHHPPHCPDLAPSGFWLFGPLKGAFQGSSLDESDELLSFIQEISKRVDHETLNAVFQERMI
jgi:hypothetical protein